MAALAPSCLGELVIALNFFVLRFRRQRTDRGARLRPDTDLLDFAYQLLDKYVVDAVLHQQAGAGGADLPAVARENVRGVGGGFVQVGVLEDDVRRLAAQFERQRDHPVGGDVPDLLARAHASGERDFAHQRMRHQRRPGLAACAQHHVEDTRRQSAFFGDDPRKLHCGRRRLLGRFHDHGVSRRQRRRRSPRGLVQGNVPGRNDADHAKRLAACIGVIARADVKGLAVVDVDQSGIEFEIARGGFEPGRRLRGGCSVFARFDFRQQLHVLADRPRHFEHHFGAIHRAAVAPFGKRGRGGPDGGVHVGFVAAGDARDAVARARIELIEIIARRRRDGLAGDEMIQDVGSDFSLNGGCHTGILTGKASAQGCFSSERTGVSLAQRPLHCSESAPWPIPGRACT